MSVIKSIQDKIYDIYYLLEQVMNWLTKPSPALHNKVQYLEARLLEALLLLLAVVNTIAWILFNHYKQDIDMVIMSLWTLMIMIYWTLYGISRTRHYRIIGIIAIAMTWIVSTMVLFATSISDAHTFVGGFFLPVILSAIWFDLKGTFISVAMCIVSITIFEIRTASAGPETGTIIILSGLVLLIILVWHRNQVEVERQAELRKLNFALQTSQEQIKVSLKQKEILLKELYHRTKNNMQVICALLSLQSSYLKNRELAQVLKEIIHRIKSMALVHEKLYQSRDLSQIDLKEYLQDIGNKLLKSYGMTPDRVSINYSTLSIPITIDSAIPCGLIINEIITNSLKHAFPDNRRGEISIGLSTVDNEIVIRIADNGIGMPENFDLKNEDSFGMQIIKNLVEHQLGGKLELNLDQGVEFLIRFTEIKPIRKK